jgi:signal transduction histidine kinase
MSQTVTILTVDDNDALRYTLTRTLRGEGYKVIEARTGLEALQLAGQSPDLITLDLNLPDLDGYEVCRRLKTNPQTAHIPILHISATFVQPEHRVRGLDGGADAFLAEPISGAELLATVGALLRMKQAEREARLQAAEAERAKQELKKAHDELERRVQERTLEIAQKNQEVRKLTGRLLRSQDDERRRLARELHDSTGQMLAAMKMNLDFIKLETKGQSSRVETLVAETSNMTDEINRQLRTMSYLLHPPLLDETGLQSALKWYVEGFAQRSGIRVQLEIDPQFPRLPEDLEIALFRVVQESLTNVHRHSGNTKATIALEANPQIVRLEIVDASDERTDQPTRDSKFTPGVGMMGMQERIGQFDGTIEIVPTDTGTAVIAKIPMNGSLREAV